MTKKLWKVCSHCGAVTDLDEIHCPVCGECRESSLVKKFFDGNQLRELVERRKFWTKHPGKIEEWIKN